MIKTDESDVLNAELESQSQRIDAMAETMQAQLKISSNQGQQMHQILDLISKQSSQINQVFDMINKVSRQTQSHGQRMDRIVDNVDKQSSLIKAHGQQIDQIVDIISKKTSQNHRQTEMHCEMIDSMTSNLHEALIKLSSSHDQRMVKVIEITSKQASKQTIQNKVQREHLKKLQKQNESLIPILEKLDELKEIVTEQGHEMTENFDHIHEEFSDIRSQLMELSEDADLLCDRLQGQFSHIIQSMDEPETKLRDLKVVAEKYGKYLLCNNADLEDVRTASDERGNTLCKVDEITDIERRIELYLFERQHSVVARIQPR